jgi:hypothetical protein
VTTPNITLTANLDDTSGVADAGSGLRITLCNYGLVVPRVVGTAMLAKVKQLVISPNGVFSLPLWANDQISPTGTFYEIAMLDDARNVVQAGMYRFTGAGTVDLSTATQIFNGGSGGSFAILSFTGIAASLELGAMLVNPTWAATYSELPASANITNTDGIDSPLVLTTPFASGAITGTFTKTTAASTTFTLSATQGSTQTAMQVVNWNPRIFSGTGTSGGATGATASGTSAVLVGDTGTLPSAGLGAETVGQTFVFTGLTGEYIYLILTGGSHTFVDANTGFPFAMNAPVSITFTNVNGVNVNMFIYQCPNGLFGNYSPRITA